MDGSAQDEEEEFALACAAIEPVAEFLEVAREVLGADAVKRPAQPGLQVREHFVDPG